MEALAETYHYELTSVADKLERGEDPERKSGYGAITEFREEILWKIRSVRANPQEIADKILEIIETPAGQRQLRYRVGPGGPGVERVNAVTSEVQAEMLDAFGVARLAKFKTAHGGAE